MKTKNWIRENFGQTRYLACATLVYLLAGIAVRPAAAQAVYPTPYTFMTLTTKTPAKSTTLPSLDKMPSAEAVAVDCAGNVFVASARKQTISELTPDGKVKLIAGKPGCPGFADGKGAEARFNYPRGLAMDRAGNIYVADAHNNAIRRVSPDGMVTTVAGGPDHDGSADGLEDEAQFQRPLAVAVSGAGDIFVADSVNNTIRKITRDGVVTTVAGVAGEPGSEDGAGSEARFRCPSGLALDYTGNVYVADTGNNLIRKITLKGAVTTLAGGLDDRAGDVDGTGRAAKFFYPGGLAVDATGNVYVADVGNDVIRRIAPSGAVITLAGLGGDAGAVDGTGGAVRFAGPLDLKIDAAGNLYVADSCNQVVRKGIPGFGLTEHRQAWGPKSLVTER